MKQYYSDFAKQNNPSMHPFYIISGDEPFQKNKALEKIQSLAKKNHFLEFTRIYPDGTVDLNALFFSRSLFQEKKCIVIDAQTQAISSALSDLLSNIQVHAERIIIVLLPRVDFNIQKSAWFSHLENQGLHISVWPITIGQLPQWIMHSARELGIQIQADAAKQLAKMTEGNLLACAQLIEKCHLGGWKQIDGTLLAQMQEDPRPTLFSLVSTCLSGDLSKSLYDLQRLKNEGLELILILWGLTREIRTLLQAKLVGHSISAIQAWQKVQRLPREHQHAQQQFCQRHTERSALHLLKMSAQLDDMLKGQFNLDPWQQADMLIVYCCNPIQSEI